MVTQGRKLAARSYPSEHLRILIDARKLGHGGIGVYTDNLIRGLLGLRRTAAHQSAVLDSVFDAIAVGDGRWTTSREEIERNGATERLRIGVITAPGAADKMVWRSQVEVIEDAAAPYSLDELFLMPRRLPWERYDLFHTPHYMLPYGIPIPSIVTLHDLIHLQTPQQWYYPWVAGRLIHSALARASRVICVSQATYSDVRHFTHEAPRVLRNVRVVSNAVDPFFLEEPLDTPGGNSPRSKQPYFLSILSTLKPHKGFDDLLKAWGVLERTFANREDVDKPRLIIVGQGTDRCCDDPALLQRVSEMPGVTLAGPVSKDELRLWYKYARALVVPSLREGFGLPVVEAHAAGAPVVMRPVPALLELVATGDYTAQDMTVDAFADTMVSAWEGGTSSKATSYSASRASIKAETAARFDLIDVARATMHVYQEAMEDLRR
jgi:glycosyltransferase involved in cell wall biosynthesis